MNPFDLDFFLAHLRSRFPRGDAMEMGLTLILEFRALATGEGPSHLLEKVEHRLLQSHGYSVFQA